MKGRDCTHPSPPVGAAVGIAFSKELMTEVGKPVAPTSLKMDDKAPVGKLPPSWLMILVKIDSISEMIELTGLPLPPVGAAVTLGRLLKMADSTEEGSSVAMLPNWLVKLANLEEAPAPVPVGRRVKIEEISEARDGSAELI